MFFQSFLVFLFFLKAFSCLPMYYGKSYVNELSLSTPQSKSNINELLKLSGVLDLAFVFFKDTSAPNIRKKRQAGSGAGKFVESAKMPQIKVFRIFLQMLKNTWAPFHIGGTHPLHPTVPKAAVWFYKDKIVNFFFPEVGEEREKKSH